MTPRRALLAAAAAAILLAPELAYKLGALACARPQPGAKCAVMVLGTPSPSIQARRVAAGVEAYRAAGCEALLLTGWKGPGSDAAEADEMAALALAAGLPEARLIRERAARNTWENIGNSLPLLAPFARVYIVSDSLHVHRGLRYWRRRSQERRADALPVSYYRPFDLYFRKWPMALHELAGFLRDALR